MDDEARDEETTGTTATMASALPVDELRRELRAVLRELSTELQGPLRESDLATLLVEASVLAAWPVERAGDLVDDDLERGDLDPVDRPMRFDDYETAAATVLAGELERASRDGSSARARASWALLLLLQRMPATAAGHAAGTVVASDPSLLELHERPAWLDRIDDASVGDVWTIDVADAATRLWLVDLELPGSGPLVLEVEQDRMELGAPRQVALLDGTATAIAVEAAADLHRAASESDETGRVAEDGALQSTTPRSGDPERVGPQRVVPSLRDALAVARVLATYGADDEDVNELLGMLGWAVAQLVDSHLSSALAELDALGANAELKAMAEHGIFASETAELTWWRDTTDEQRSAAAAVIAGDDQAALDAAALVVDVACDRFLDGLATCTPAALHELAAELVAHDFAADDAARLRAAAMLGRWFELTRPAELSAVFGSYPAPAPAAASEAARSDTRELLTFIEDELHELNRRHRFRSAGPADQAQTVIRMVAAMRADGVDPSNDDARIAWMEQWELLSHDEQLQRLDMD